jgi:hypothetical protein
MWISNNHTQGIFWSSAEREFQEFAWYYSLPTVSVKAACYHDMVAAKHGFSVHAPRERDQQVCFLATAMCFLALAATIGSVPGSFRRLGRTPAVYSEFEMGLCTAVVCDRALLSLILV